MTLQDYAGRLTVPIHPSVDILLYVYRNEAYGTRPAPSRLFATGYVRVVIGGRGPYVEFVREHLTGQLKHIGPHWYYEHYESEEGIKVYWQLRRVTYADYQPHFLYVDPTLLQTAEGVRLLTPLREQTGQLKLV